MRIIILILNKNCTGVLMHRNRDKGQFEFITGEKKDHESEHEAACRILKESTGWLASEVDLTMVRREVITKPKSVETTYVSLGVRPACSDTETTFYSGLQWLDIDMVQHSLCKSTGREEIGTYLNAAIELMQEYPPPLKGE